MASIGSFSGLASGIQWRDMVDQIMKMESSRRLTPVSNQLKLQTQRKTAWSEYSSLVSKLRDASKSLSDGSALGVFKTSVGNSGVSGRALVGATVTEKASPGTYNVEVLQLAQAEKLGSAAVTDSAAGLGLAGTFHVNGQAVTVASGDSLAALRDKINAANTGSNASGVSATILSTSSTSHRLILTAEASGSRGIELVDSTSGVLKDPKLGILTGTQSSNASTEQSGWTDSLRFSSKSRVLMDVLGVTPPPAVAGIMVGGTKVEIDFSKDTLEQVLTKIKAADPLAKIREEVVNGKTMYRLSTSKPVAVDPNSAASQRNLELLGFVKNASASQISAGQDAKFQVDGYNLTRRSNTVTDAIEGVTLNLLATDAGSRTFSVTGSGLSVFKEAKGINAGTYAIALSTATSSKTAVDDSNHFDVVAGTEENAAVGDYGVSFTTKTERSFSAVPNTGYSSLGIVSAPTASVSADEYTVQATFQRAITASAGLTSVSAPETNTKAGTYAVTIDKTASRATLTGTKAVTLYTAASTSGDALILKDSAGKEITATIQTGWTAQQIVDHLNTEFSGKAMRMEAANNNGVVTLRAASRGDWTDPTSSQSQFTILTGTSANVLSQLGYDTQVSVGSPISGNTTEGTINGVAVKAADSTPTTLQLSNANNSADGLQVTYSGTTPFSGSVTVKDTVTGGTITRTRDGTSWSAGATTDTATGEVTLTGTNSLAVKFDGVRQLGPATTHSLGKVTVTDTYSLDGGTINGQAATQWNPTDKTLTLNGLSVKWTAASVPGAGPFNGTVSVQNGSTTFISGATIDGEAAVWDAATKTIRGAAGSRFEGLDLGYTGPATAGKIGDLTVAGDISVELKVERDTDASAKKVEEFVDLYNEMTAFVKRQRDAKGPLGSDASLRAMLGSMRDVLFKDVSGLSATNPYTRISLAGVEFTRGGTLEFDGTAFKTAYSTSPADIKELLAGIGAMMETTADSLADGVDGAIKMHQTTLSASISSLEQREINIQAQLERRRADMIQQYTRMEEAMSKLQSQGNWLTSQLSSLSPR